MSPKCCTRIIASTFFVLAPTTCLHAQVVRVLAPLTNSASSHAQSINANGLVVGYSTTSGLTDYPTLWRPGADGTYGAEPLPLPAGMLAGGANAISSTGLIAGYALSHDGETAAAVLWTPTGPSGAYVANTLSTPAGMGFNSAYAVNAGGQVAGFGGLVEGDSIAMAWTPAAVPLPPVTSITNGYELLATGINDAGDVAGYGLASDGTAATSYVWRPDGAGGYTRKTVIAADTAAVTAINRNGTGTGIYAGDQPMVVSLSGGEYYATPLPSPPDSSNGGSDAVNNYNGIVGYSMDPSTPIAGNKAAFWAPTGTGWDCFNLDTWLDQADPSLGSQWYLIEATGINDNWLTVGVGAFTFTDTVGHTVTSPRGFVLDVSSLVPEPSSATLTLVAAMLPLGRGRRTPRQPAA